MPAISVQFNSTAASPGTAVRTGLESAETVEGGVEVGVDVGDGTSDDGAAATVADVRSDQALISPDPLTARTQ